MNKLQHLTDLTQTICHANPSIFTAYAPIRLQYGPVEGGSAACRIQVGNQTMIPPLRFKRLTQAAHQLSQLDTCEATVQINPPLQGEVASARQRLLELFPELGTRYIAQQLHLN